jgi:hypothetical protein
MDNYDVDKLSKAYYYHRNKPSPLVVEEIEGIDDAAKP